MGKREGCGSRGQHIKAEHQMQLNDQLYCKKNNRYCDKLEKRQFIQTHRDPMLHLGSGHSTSFKSYCSRQCECCTFVHCVVFLTGPSHLMKLSFFPFINNAKYLNSI